LALGGWLDGTAGLSGPCAPSANISAPLPRLGASAFRAAGLAPFRLTLAGDALSLANLSDAAAADVAVRVPQSDPCALAQSCGECVAKAGCAYCNATRTCVGADACPEATLHACDVPAASPALLPEWLGEWAPLGGGCTADSCCCLGAPLVLSVDVATRTLALSAPVSGACGGRQRVAARLPLPALTSNDSSSTTLALFDASFAVSKRGAALTFASTRAPACGFAAARAEGGGGGSSSESRPVYERGGFIAGITIACVALAAALCWVLVRWAPGRSHRQQPPLAASNAGRAPSRYLLAPGGSEVAL
jgi:hypothetical protein